MPEPRINPHILAENQEPDPEQQEEQKKYIEEIYGTPVEEPEDDKQPQEAEQDTTQEPQEATSEEEPQPQESVQGEEIGEDQNLISQLKEEIASLKSKLQQYQQVANLVNQLGIADKDQNEQAAILGQLKRVYEDMVSVPALHTVLQKFYSGELQLEEEDVKTVADFLPEGEVYSEYDAYNDPSSPSYKARREFMKWEMEQMEKKRRFAEELENMRQQNSAVNEGVLNAAKKLAERFQQIRAKISNDFPVNDELWNEFIEFFRSGDESLITSAFGAFARKKGIKSRTEQKLEQNKSSSGFIIGSASRREQETEPTPYQVHDERQREWYKELFGEEI